ncbi:asparaginase domain-containing protein [Nitrosomonas cryotolerans]|nr:asparaginase domain-containing protein [Nitrosomonas cryotolerans]
MRIAIINTGGTISCIGEPLAPMSAADFADASVRMLNPILTHQFPDLEIGYLINIAFPESSGATLDSTNLQPTDWCIMAKGVLTNYADYDGFLVLHGTDSMDFTGAALPFLLNAFDENGNGSAVLSKPVIITGSQVPLYNKKSGNAELTINFNTDAFQNVCGAVASARTGVPEVCAYFQNKLYRGNRILKTSTSRFSAFSSPKYPALAEYGIELKLFNEHWLPGPVHDSVSLDNPDVLARQQAMVDSIAENIDHYPVAQLNAFPARYSRNTVSAYMADMISAIVSTGASGLILESYGEGNFPSGNPDSPSDGAIYQALNNATNKGVNLVDCTRVIGGSVNNSAYASGAWLPQVGALSSADMTPMSALAKLMILTSFGSIQGWSRDQLRAMFQTNLAGEMCSVNSLDSRTNAVLMPSQSICTLDGSARLTNDQAAGPVLIAVSNDTLLWSLPVVPVAADLPGRLVMQDDGNLVFYSRYNKAIWASNSGTSVGASSKLVLSGHYDVNSPCQSKLLMQVFNYATNTCAARLYQTP